MNMANMYSACNQRLYLLRLQRKHGLSDESIVLYYDATVLSKVLYALSG